MQVEVDVKLTKSGNRTEGIVRALVENKRKRQVGILEFSMSPLLGEVRLNSITVARHYRRTGVGRKMYEAAEKVWREHGMKFVTATPVTEEGLHFLESMGFEVRPTLLPSKIGGLAIKRLS